MIDTITIKYEDGQKRKIKFSEIRKFSCGSDKGECEENILYDTSSKGLTLS